MLSQLNLHFITMCLPNHQIYIYKAINENKTFFHMHARTMRGNNFLNTREWFALSTAASIHVLPSTSTIDAFSTANYVSVCSEKGHWYLAMV